MRIRKAAPALACLLALLSPGAALSLSQVCIDAFNAGDAGMPPQRAVELQTRCLETGQPDDVARAMIVYNRGNMHRLLGQPQRALEDYGQAIRLNKPRLHEAYTNRGGVQLEQGRFAESIADFDQAIRLKPDDVFALCNRGFAFFHLAKPEQALADFDQALRFNPRYATAWYGRGQLRESQGQFQAAREDYGQALALEPNHVLAVNALAWLLAVCPDEALRDGTRAVALAQKAVGLQRSPAHLDTLAAAQARSGQYAEAVKSQEEALGLLAPASKARAGYEQRLALYRAGAPYADPPRKP